MVIIIIAAAVVLITVLVLLYFRKKERERKAVEEQRFKNQVLDAALKNNAETRSVISGHKGLTPMELNSSQEQQKDIRTRMIKLSVTGREANNYLVNPEKHIYIGSLKDKNDIVLSDRQIAGQQGEIFLYKEKVYIRNLYPSVSIGLRRSSNYTYVTDKIIELNTGDTIELSVYRIQITIMDYIGNPIYG